MGKGKGIVVALMLLFAFGSEASTPSEDIYPVVFVHGITSQPSEMQVTIDKIPWDREQPVAELYADDAAALTGVYPRNTVWNVGYYKNSSAFSGQYEYEGRISHIPIDNPYPPQMPGYAVIEEYNSRVAYDQKLQVIIENILRVTGAPKVDIVAHSMGGLVTRSYMTFLGGSSKVHKFLMLGTPNHGTDLSGTMWFYCSNSNVQEWMDIGELSEMIGSYDSDYPAYLPTSCTYGDKGTYIENAWEGTTYTNFLNSHQQWGDAQYATIAGTKCVDYVWATPGCDGPEDGVVNSSSVYLDGAMFNTKYNGSHTAQFYGSEFSITESTFTIETIRQWIDQSYIASGAVFKNMVSSYKLPYIPNPSGGEPAIVYQIDSGDAVAMQISIYNMAGALVYRDGRPLDHGHHNQKLNLSTFGNGTYISYVKVYDQYGELFTEKWKVAVIHGNDNAPNMPSTIVTSQPDPRWDQNTATIEFHPDAEGSLSRWSIDHGPWTDWSTERSLAITDSSPGFHVVQLASKLDIAGSLWSDQSVAAVTWFQYDSIVDPVTALAARDAKYDQGNRLALGWEKSAEDASKVTSYEIMHFESEDNTYESIGYVGAGTERVVDTVDPASDYHYYIVRTHSAEGYEDSEPAYSPPPVDNVPSELVLTRTGEDSFRFALIDAEPLTEYIVETFHHTDIDYKQESATVVTDASGSAAGSFSNTRDDVSEDSYTYATARKEPSDPETTYTSNRIHNATQVIEAFTLSVLPENVSEASLTVSGTKNANTSVWLDGEELIPLDAQTTWETQITLDPGTATLVFKSKNSDGDVNGLALAQVVYQNGNTFVADTQYDNGDGLTVTWQTDTLGVTEYEVQRKRASDGQVMFIGKRPADANSLVDRSVTPEEAYTYEILAYTGDGAYETIFSETLATSPLDNIPRQILVSRKAEDTFSFELIDAEPFTLYTIHSYHHTDTDYEQAALDVTTDRDGHASGEIYSADYSVSGRNYYVYVEAVRTGETLVSNRIATDRQVNSTLAVDTPPESTREKAFTLSGTKNADTSLSINDKEEVTYSADTTWSVPLVLEEGKNTFVITTQNAEGEINAHVIARIVYVTGPEEAPTLNPVTSPTTASSQTLSGTKPAQSSLWINGVLQLALDESTSWTSMVSLAEGWNALSIDARDEWERPSVPVAADIFLDSMAPTAPTIDAFADPVNASAITLYGNKDSNTSIWVNGAEEVPINADTRFAVYVELPVEGENPFSFTARDQTGGESAATAIVVHRDTTVPAEVLNFSAIWNGEAVSLSWQNPDDPDFDHVSLGKMRENPRALYVWDEGNVASDLINDVGTTRDELFAFLASPHGLLEKPIRTLYLQAVSANTNHVVDNAANVRSFIAEANANKVRVVYLDGDPSWATTNTAIAQERLLDVLAFNTAGAANEHFVGIQFDVEPYLLDGWYSDEIWGIYVAGETYTGYLGMLGKAQESVEASGQDIFFSVDIPFWYDDGVSGHPNLHEDVITIVDEVILMDYRDSAWGSGHGGIIQLGETELAYAQSVGKAVTIGVETQDIDPDYITFFEEGVSRMEDELAWVWNEMSSSSAFHELAIHYYTPYRNLKWENSSPLVWDILGSEGDGGDDAAEKLVGIVQGGSLYFIESMVHLLPQVSLTAEELKVGIDSVEGADPQLPVDIYIGKTVSATQIADPILVKSNWIPEWHGSWQSLALDVPYALQAGQSYGVWFKTKSAQGVEGNHYLRISADDSSTTEVRLAARTDTWYTRDMYGALQAIESDPAVYTHTPLDRWFSEVYSGKEESYLDALVTCPETLIYRIYALDAAANASSGETAKVDVPENN